MSLTPYVTAAVTLGVNLIIIAYAWGKLQQLVYDLQKIVDNLQNAVDTIFPRINASEVRVATIEAICAERHK